MDKYEKLVDEFRCLVKETAEEKLELKRKLKTANENARYWKEKVYRLRENNPEISDSEQYLVEKIERLEEELRMAKCKV